MLKTRELRRGNWVESPAESHVRFQIQEIENKDKLHLNPIKLSHDMIAPWRRDYMNRPKWFDFGQFQMDPNFWVVVGVTDVRDPSAWNGYNLGIQIEYVHQLQNLFYLMNFNSEMDIRINKFPTSKKPTQYIHKPVSLVPIEAVHYLGNGNIEGHAAPDWWWMLFENKILQTTNGGDPLFLNEAVFRLEVRPGDYVVRTENGNIYCLGKVFFEMSYEKYVESDEQS